jgi:hypothetical protein
MKQLTKLLLLSVLLCLLPSESIAQKSTRKKRRPSQPKVVSKIVSVEDDPIGRAFASGASDIQVAGAGTVVRILEDDLNGSRHQRFIVQLASGQTLLMTHNIDIAPRIDRLEAGDSIRFNGEYVWNSKGGVIHWTHHDPRGKHVAGWVMHNGKTYQ